MENVKAKTALSFDLNMMALMLQVGRTEEAADAARRMAAVIQALPDDLFVDIELEEPADA